MAPYSEAAPAEVVVAGTKYDATMLIPPKDLVGVGRQLGYPAGVLAALGDVAEKMTASQTVLQGQGIGGGRLSNSLEDKAKLFKDAAHKPQETFFALFGTDELTLENYAAVFDRIFTTKLDRINHNRVAKQDMATTQAWFQLFNAVVKKMPAQNAYLLGQAVRATGAVTRYANQKPGSVPVDPAIAADELYRLTILVSNESFDVAGLVFGDSMNDAVIHHLPPRALVEKIFGSAGTPLATPLYDIAEAGARGFLVAIDEYKKLIDMRQETARIRQENEKARQENAERDKRTAERDKRISLMDATFTIYRRLDGKFQSLSKNLNTQSVKDEIRQDMHELRSVRAQWEALPLEQKKMEAYVESMKLITNIERLGAKHGINY